MVWRINYIDAVYLKHVYGVEYLLFCDVHFVPDGDEYDVVPDDDEYCNSYLLR